MDALDKLYENIDKLFAMVNKETEKVINKGDLTPVEADNLKKAFCMLKEAQEVRKNEMMSSDFDNIVSEGMSGYYDAMPSGARMRNARTGRFMSNGRDGGSSYAMPMNSGRRGSYGRGSYGYSGHYGQNSEIIEQLEDMLAGAKTPEQRKMVENWINQMEQ